MRVSRSSTTRVRTPCPPRMLARVSPTGPAPTTTTSTRSRGSSAPAASAVCGVTLVSPKEFQVQAVERLRVLILRPVAAAGHHLERGPGDHRGDAFALLDV